MKKILITILSILSCLLFSLGLVACNNDVGDTTLPESTVLESGIKLLLSEDKQYYKVVGLVDEYSIDIIIPDTYYNIPIKTIENYAFQNASDIKSIKLSNYTQTIGGFVFDNCIGIKEIYLPKSLISIDWCAFRNCINLEKVFFEENIKLNEIPSRCFFYCKKLKFIEIPKSIKRIGEYAFYNCNKLTNIFFDENSFLTYLGGNAFEDCSSIKTLILPDNITALNSFTFRDCSSLEYVKLPQNLKIIEHYTFSGCSNLLRVEIPNKITTIFANTFNNCKNLYRVSLPVSIENIEANAFYGCNNLTNVYFDGTEEQWNNASTGILDSKVKSANIYFSIDKYSILFDYKCELPNFSEVIYNDEKAIEPVVEAREDYIFVGWFYNNKKWDFDETIKKSIVLQAQWQKDK